VTGWRGLIEEYRDHLPVSAATPVVTLHEGNTPLVPAPRLSERVGARVWLKVEGANPTGSFKDRGMTVAISKAVEEGSKAVICGSTGNTSALRPMRRAPGSPAPCSSPTGTSRSASWPRR
jgi:threonine synthase